MLTSIINKVRALISDLGNSQDNEAWLYTTSKVFKIATPNAATPSSVLKNGTAVSLANWSYNTTTQEITISASETMVSGDVVTANFTSYKYSSNEIKEHIRGALVYLSVFSYSSSQDFELETDDIMPTPTKNEEDLIAMITSIIIKPDWEFYKTPTLEVRYKRLMDKDEKIERLTNRAKWGLGDFGLIELE